ncbi:hypothetical protein QF042_004766 [Pedobacter sp. W3I1]|nr:hypothetical protein [Pedobacter sp. W3I1]
MVLMKGAEMQIDYRDFEASSLFINYSGMSF